MYPSRRLAVATSSSSSQSLCACRIEAARALLREARREAGGELEDRVGEDVDDEGGSTAPAVCSTAENERTDRSHG